jgi:hypothetical protein
MINDMLFLEFSGYQTLRFNQQNSLGLDPFASPGLFNGVAPYWRAAFEPHWRHRRCRAMARPPSPTQEAIAASGSTPGNALVFYPTG